MLDSACRELGFCIPATDQVALCERIRLSAEQFANAVLQAEGFDPVQQPKCQDDLVACFKKHFGDDLVVADSHAEQ